MALFVDYYLSEGALHAERVGYVELPERANVWARKRVAARITSSILGAGGSQPSTRRAASWASSVSSSSLKPLTPTAPTTSPPLRTGTPPPHVT